MKNTNDHSRNQPEFTTEYIDQLFSTRAPAEADDIPVDVDDISVEASDTPIPPTVSPRKKLSRKALLRLILGAGLLMVALIFLPNALARLQSQRWQAHAEAAYLQLISQEVYHIRARVYAEYDGTKSESLAELWRCGEDSLTIDTSDKITSYSLIKDHHYYRKIVTAANPDAQWSYYIYSDYKYRAYPETLSDSGYTFSSISGSLAGVKVTFYKPPASNNIGQTYTSTLCFRFNLLGNLVGIVSERQSSGQTNGRDFTFLPANEKKIAAVIEQHYEEATKK